MANVNAPFGLKPIGKLGSAVILQEQQSTTFSQVQLELFIQATQ